MNKIQKKHQKKINNSKRITTETKAATIEPIKKSLLYSILMGSGFGSVLGILIFSIILFLYDNFPYGDIIPLFFVLLFIMSVLVVVWLISTPCFLISKKEITVVRKNKQDIRYAITPSLHIKITMMAVSGKKHSGTSLDIQCLLFMTFMDDQLNIKKRWISGYYTYEQARDLIFALEDNHVRYYLKGYNAKRFAGAIPYNFQYNAGYRRIKVSNL
ncbi:hypothetical protein RHO13_01760 [Orbus wheelerorum]|uniref:hypothetical protein n=1 Tax=Orbus wheelerorum TaxID=3074111 RepID=UPI00370DD8D0